MDATQHDPVPTAHETPGQEDGEDPPDPVASTMPPQSGGSSHAGASSLPAEALAALPGLIGRWRHRWEIPPPANGMYTAQRRDHDHEAGACTYLDVFISASTAEALDAEITKWEDAQ